MFVIAIGFLYFSINSYTSLQQLNRLKQDVSNIKVIASLINELQRERGMSIGYLANHNEKSKERLINQHKVVDNSFLRFITLCNTQDKALYLQKDTDLLAIRLKIINLQLPNIESFDYYTNLIKNLQNHYLQTSMLVDDNHVKNYLQVYTNIAQMKESLGQIRGSFNGIFSMHFIDKSLLSRAIHAKGMYDAALYHFQATAPNSIQKKYTKIIQHKEFSWMLHIIHKYSIEDIQQTDEDPGLWWNNVSDLINLFYRVEKDYFKLIDKYVTKKSTELFQELIFNILFLLIVTLFVIWLSYTIKNNIIRNINLLNQYKNVVDRSSIVSKTNKKGIITYTNEQFCKISGYRKEELIGKPHSIVRHQDMPKEAFKDMWKTILAKKPWNGIVKNKKKDGSFYIVEATINPILNEHDEIEEFIAVRNDITKVIQLNEEIKHTQNDLIYRMSELTETRSKETGFHVRRVAKYSQLLAQYYGLSHEEIEYLTLASPMHDIGKVAIPDSILHKPSQLTSEEWEIMKTHTTIGFNLFKDSEKPLLQTAAIIAHQHHEKYDGTGYPRGLKGDEIHIYARITALADTFDALNSKRSYKSAWSEDKIFTYLKEESGKHFDPKLVKIFFDHLDAFLVIQNMYKDGSAFMKEKEKNIKEQKNAH